MSVCRGSTATGFEAGLQLERLHCSNGITFKDFGSHGFHHGQWRQVQHGTLPGTVADVHDTSRILNALFDILGKDTVILHAKDCNIQDGHVVHIDEVLLGTGSMNYDIILPRMLKECPNAYVLIEHLSDDKVPLARAAIGKVAQRLGIEFDA